MENKANIIEESRESFETLRYSGDLTISVMENERIISTRKIHNTGCKSLFMFFANCLAGEWSAAKSLRPCKIILFKTATGEDLTGETKSEYWTKSTQVSTKVTHDTAIVTLPITETKNGKTSTIGYCAKYHFRIPYLCLNEGQNVTKMALFPGDRYISGRNYFDSMCAYYRFPSEEAGILIPPTGGNYTIIVDWTLNIKNK